MKKGLIIFGCIFTIFLINCVSAGIYFSQSEQTYNIGDIFSISIDVEPINHGFLSIELVCDGDELNIFNGIPVEGNAKIEFPLTNNYIENMSGVCYLIGKYGGEEKQSREFKISNELNVQLDIDSIFAKPEEEIILSGTAKRLNGAGVNGRAEIRIIGLTTIEEPAETNESETNETQETSSINYDSGIYYGRVEEGNFLINFTLLKETPASDYTIEVEVYEIGDDGKRASYGTAIANLKVSSILTKIDIALSEQSVNPGIEFDFKPRFQTGKNINDDVSVIIRDSESNRVFERIVKSGETINYNIPGNMTSGYYEIEASKGDISNIKKFYIKEKAIASFELTNETVLVTNTGNIPYKKDIQIELNGKPFVKKIDLELGEIQEFRLSGSNEEYDIKISDGDTEISQTGVVLTGHAIGVKEIRQGANIALKTPIVWILFIILLAGILFFIFRNSLKKKSFAYPFKKNKKIKDLTKKPVEIKPVKEDKKIKEVQKSGALVAPNHAEQVLVLNGQKNKASVLVLKIKNKLSDISKQSLEKSIEPVYEKRGAVYEQGDFIYIIYSPLMTRTFNNEAIAARTAEKIKKVLQEHNKKFKDKIEFGIGINSGDIINKVENKKLKFTALGNLISNAKKLADSSNEQILITKEAYEKNMTEIKADKKEIQGKSVYEVRAVIDRGSNSKFIEGFLERLKQE